MIDENECWRFKYLIGFWDGVKYSVGKGITCAPTYADAMRKLAAYYGEHNIANVRCLMPFGKADAADADVIVDPQI